MMHIAHLWIHSFIGIGSHTSVNPPSVVPVITPHISMDTLLGYTIKAKYSKTVYGPCNFTLVGQGTDSGFIVPHIGIPPNNVLIPLIIAFGGSKPMFAASTVKIDVDGSALSTACVAFPEIPVSINQACNDPCNYPSDIVISPNTIVCGLTMGDYIAGIAAIVVDVIISAIASAVGGALGEHVVKAVASVVMRKAAQEIAKELGEQSYKEILKDIVENVAEHKIAQVIATLIEKLFGVGIDKIQDATGSGDALDEKAHDAAGETPPKDTPAPPTPPATNTLTAPANPLTNDPRIHQAA